MQQFLIISCLFFFFLAPLQAQESENKIVIENNEYTLHKVKPGETLFSISKKYGLSVEELKKANRLSESSSIDFDRILIIPLFAALEKEEQQEMQETSTAFFTHKVEQGETLYSIARAYENVSPAQIKLMNDLKSDTLRIGMLLEIPQQIEDIQKETDPSVQFEIAKDSSAQINEKALFKADTTQRTTADSAKTHSFFDQFDKEALLAFRKKFEHIDTLNQSYEVERGVGTWLDAYSNSGREHFFAQHKSAALGSILKVRNLMNNRTVYVKVIGKLPDAERNSGIIIKISEATAQFLNILDEKFLVEIIEKKERS